MSVEGMIAIVVVSFLVALTAGGLGEKYLNSQDAERQIVVAAQRCWDNDQRAVYVRVDDDYRIRCEP